VSSPIAQRRSLPREAIYSWLPNGTRATRSTIDGIHLIERINAHGALIKVLDKPYLDLTTPLGRGFIAFLSAMVEGRKSATDRAVVSSSSQTLLEKFISCLAPDKNGSIRAPKTGRVSRDRLKFGRRLAPGAPHCLQTKCRHAHGFLRRRQLLCEPPIARLAAATWGNKPHRSLFFSRNRSIRRRCCVHEQWR